MWRIKAYHGALAPPSRASTARIIIAASRNHRDKTAAAAAAAAPAWRDISEQAASRGNAISLYSRARIDKHRARAATRNSVTAA